jgi:hypothetical protein
MNDFLGHCQHSVVILTLNYERIADSAIEEILEDLNGHVQRLIYAS